MADGRRESPALSRRQLLQASAASAAAVALGVPPFGSRPALAQSKLSPDAALQRLMNGNARFVAGQLRSPNRDLAKLREHTAEQQQPFAAVLACADSRVPVEWVFDQTIGRIFVTRVAGNTATPEVIASLEYGAAILGAKVIMVLGHGNCGAVSSAIAVKHTPGQISALYAPLRQAIDQANGDLVAAIKANAMIQAAILRESSPALGDLIDAGELTVVSGYYDLVSGAVTLLG